MSAHAGGAGGPGARSQGAAHEIAGGSAPVDVAAPVDAAASADAAAPGSVTDASWAFAAYEAVRSRLPSASFGSASGHCAHLGELADRYDVFLLDAFGVLNVGERAIPGVAARIDALRAARKTVIVVTNAASYPFASLRERYRRLGFDFDARSVVSSRMALFESLPDDGRIWGLMAAPEYGRDELPANARYLADDRKVYAGVDGFLLLGSSTWTDARQELLEATIAERPREVRVGNPDIIAPRETGFSREPGHYAHRLADVTGIEPVFYGKPFGNVFDLVRARLPAGTRDDRVVMVGDSLHTDVLGGRAAGFATALVTGYGFFAGVDPSSAIADSGIVPDWILPRP
ncbi:MAG: HAD hydrolase-like protein [Burkholderiaceae bacterium]